MMRLAEGGSALRSEEDCRRRRCELEQCFRKFDRFFGFVWLYGFLELVWEMDGDAAYDKKRACRGHVEGFAGEVR